MRAKFRCMSVEQFQHSELAKLAAVTDEAGTNKEWAAATPSGTLTLQIDNPKAQGHFRPGRSYYLDVTDAGDE